jgi:predicted metal-dependent peptidase
MNARELLAAGRLMVKYTQAPYLATAVDSLVPREMEGLGTVAVTEHGVLLWDPAVVGTWTVEEIAGAIQHEVWHLLRDHLGRCRRIGAFPQLWNIAADLEINDDLATAQVKLPTFKDVKGPDGKPGTACYPKDFGMPDGKLAEEYYNQLRQKAQIIEVSMGGGDSDEKGSPSDQDGAGGDQDAKGGGKGQPRVGAGWCGSGAGRKVPGEPDEKGKGGEGEGRTAGELASVRQQVAEAIRQQGGKGRGNVPADFLRWAEEALKPPRIRWEDKLARAARGCVAYRPGAQDYHYTRSSRRQGAVGWGMGHPILPAMREPIPEVLIVTDTSGSMGAKEHERAISESAAILKATTARVTFMALDTDIHSMRPVRRWQELLPLLRGGGGTDFRPAFEQVGKMKSRPDVIVFITDGCGPAPVAPPPKVSVVWLLVGAHRAVPYMCGTKDGYQNGGPVTWGQIIEVDDAEEVDLP